jgi:hypothetical protein
MKFRIEDPPPAAAEIEAERARIGALTASIQQRDTIITFLLIVITSILMFLSVFWATDDIRYAGAAAAVFPVIGTVLAVTGLITVAGFRSAARQVLELKHQLIALTPISGGSEENVRDLGETYAAVREYTRQVEEQGRALVNGELSMFWEWDTSTLAKQDRRRELFDKARETINAESGA